MSAVIRAGAVGKRYGERAALREVSFEVGKGELVAIVGPNGAGKTTLLSILAGTLEPSSGSVAVAGGERVGWAPQQPALYSKLSVAENLRLFARLERVSDLDAAVERMLAQTGLAGRRDERVGRLSGGNRQRVNVALGLIADPQVLVLDEPSASLDPAQRARLWEFIASLARGGTTVLFSTHFPAEAQRYAERLILLDGGQLLFDGSTSELLAAGGQGENGALEDALLVFLDQRRTPEVDAEGPPPS